MICMYLLLLFTYIAICPRDCTTYYEFLGNTTNTNCNNSTVDTNTYQDITTDTIATNIYCNMLYNNTSNNNLYTDTQWNIIDTLWTFYTKNVSPVFNKMNNCTYKNIYCIILYIYKIML